MFHQSWWIPRRIMHQASNREQEKFPFRFSGAMEGRLVWLCSSAKQGDKACSAISAAACKDRTPGWLGPGSSIDQTGSWQNELAMLLQINSRVAAAGEQFFFGEGGCDSCHMIAGRGKTNGPDLSDAGRQLTLRDIEQALDEPSSRLGSRSPASCPGWAWMLSPGGKSRQSRPIPSE